MKKLLFTMATNIVAIFCLAQYPNDLKFENTWIFGYESSIDQNFGNTIMKFNGSSFDTSYRDANAESYLCNSSISDSNGNFLFFSQGFCAYDSAFEKIEGTDSMNCCNIVFQGNYNDGYPMIDGVAIVKIPKSDNKYMIIHKPGESFPNYPLSLSLRSTILINETDSFKGISKDNIIFSDSIAGLGIELCRHANGRDWWLIQKHYKKNKYFIFLINQNGAILHDSVEFIGYVPRYFCQSIFSPDGNKYIIAGTYNALNDSMFVAKFDFDRCTGTLSNPEYLYWKEDYTVSSGCAVSPNSKYLYVCSTLDVYQFDLTIPNWQSTKLSVATYDDFNDTITGSPWSTAFGLMQLAPDNKIYFTGGNTTYLNTIDNPDEAGVACNVNQHSFRLSAKNQRTMPNFPNYRMGPIDGSDCDTLGIDVINNIEDRLDNNTSAVYIYPNPASDYITLMIPRITKEWEFVIYDIQGKEVFRNKSRGAFRSYDVSFLASGLYVWKLRYDDGRSEYGKLVKE